MDLEDLEIVLAGEFNCDWLCQNGKIKKKIKLVEIIETLQLQQIINEPTRV